MLPSLPTVFAIFREPPPKPSIWTAELDPTMMDFMVLTFCGNLIYGPTQSADAMVLKIFSSSHSHADLAPHVCFLMNHHIIFAYLPTSNHLFSSFLIFSPPRWLPFFNPLALVFRRPRAAPWVSSRMALPVLWSWAQLRWHGGRWPGNSRRGVAARRGADSAIPWGWGDGNTTWKIDELHNHTLVF